MEYECHIHRIYVTVDMSTVYTWEEPYGIPQGERSMCWDLNTDEDLFVRRNEMQMKQLACSVEL